MITKRTTAKHTETSPQGQKTPAAATTAKTPAEAQQQTPLGPPAPGAKPHQVIKLGVDAHWNEYVVARQIDEAAPQPPQRFSPEAFLAWAAKQATLAETLYCCYEAGPFGFVLHRKLEALGVKNTVVRPRNWDEYGQRVKTDRRDASALLSCLDRWLAGNTRALTPVRVPTETEERARSESRQREQMRQHRQRMSAQGLGTARYYGHDLPERWWGKKAFAVLKETLPDFLVKLLEVWRQALLVLDEQVGQLSEAVESAQDAPLPIGMGALTAQIIEREVANWKRFKNRRQVASYTGLVPREHSTGNTRVQGSITKHGNPRVRKQCIELAWRLQRFQPGYRAVRRRLEALAHARLRNNSAARKKLIVGLAREFMVDWWRIRTGKVQPETLGLSMGWPSARVLQDKIPSCALAQDSQRDCPNGSFGVQRKQNSNAGAERCSPPASRPASREGSGALAEQLNPPRADKKEAATR